MVLHEACHQGITRVIKHFLDNYIKHIDINQLVAYYPNYYCYVQSSITRDILPYYLKAHYKNSLLHAAIRKGSVDVVILLLEKGADIEQNDYCHKTPIIAAIECDCVDIVTLLVNASAGFVDFYCLRASCFFHESYLGNTFGFQQCQRFFKKH